MRAFSFSVVYTLLGVHFALSAMLPTLAIAQDSLTTAESALYAATQQRDIPGQLQAIQQIAEHYLKVERPKRALSYYRLGLETDPSELGKANLLRQISQVHLDLGELDHAQLFVQESIRILRTQAKLKSEVNTAPSLTLSLITMAHIRLEGLDFFQAQEDINEAFRLSRTLKDDTLIDKSYRALVRLREKQGNVEGTKTVLLEWAKIRKTREDKESTLTLATNTTALSLCEKNWKENNFAGALKAARSSFKHQNTSGPQPSPALELCKAKSLIKLNRHQELLDDYAKLPPQHPLVNAPGMQLLVSRSLMGLEQYAKATAVSQAALKAPGIPLDLQFALLENLILIELQSPSTPANQNLLSLCDQAEQISSNNNSPVWSECALINASAGKFDKALAYTQSADLWFAEFGSLKQRIENRLIKALMQVELGDVEEGLLSVNVAINQIEKAKSEGSNSEPTPNDFIAFERQTNEILGMAAEKKGEHERAANFYKLALNAANTENNEVEMERLAVKLATLNTTTNKPANQAASQKSSTPITGAFTRVLTWFEQLRTPEYLRSLNPFKKKAE
jgi:tetratricopeptide (TPR) repeat protein